MNHQAATENNAIERYLLNELASAERDEFEEHFFECADCAAGIRALAPFTANLKAELRNTSQHIPSPIPPKPKPHWLGWLNPAWLSPAFAVLALIGFGVQTSRLNQPLAWSPRAVAGETRGAPAVVEMTASGQFAIALDVDPPPGASRVEIAIEDASGRKLARQSADSPLGGAPLNFGLRSPGFGPGKYVAVVRTEDGKEISRHPFEYVRASRRTP